MYYCKEERAKRRKEALRYVISLMCLTKPVRIISVNGNVAQVKDDHGREREIVIAAVPEAKAGDWVLVSANLAVQRISGREAGEIRRMINQ